MTWTGIELFLTALLLLLLLCNVVVFQGDTERAEGRGFWKNSIAALPRLRDVSVALSHAHLATFKRAEVDFD